ncbi:MAG: efflux transporter periplasmic adaptor subunit, partial [bacterium]|nr:efflux transporter periplasmic adaptor subunit [bacterium]
VARRSSVDTGWSAGGFVEIRSGLKPGDKIVADGLNRIQDGAPISDRPGGGAPGGKGSSPAGAGGAERKAR